ncbi:MAG TPA: TetR/AcrR family transcriptional regulator [Solirubrobacterales bacterium]|nr:TetR/AcrR family transcriptional regulator [Solirubrobacterales bacterium]
MNPDDEAVLSAVVAETVERGYADLSAEGIAERAGITASSFRARFPDERAAVEAAHAALFDRLISRLAQTCEAQATWPLKVKVGIGAALDLAAASPLEARFLIVDSVVADVELARRGIEARDRLARILAAGRTEPAGGAAALPAVSEQVLISGIVGVISARLASGEAEHLPALAPELVQLTLLPYLGPEAAAGMARRPPPTVEGL